ncbi:MAG TPA: VCBS repeat-containing protein, partial [Chitinophagaceae bacterium]|nr:VCBS repeat-containing protein [Chitinophagaceae bacterium]
LLNHSVHQNGTFAARQTFLNTFHPLTGDRLFRNEDGHFADATREAGINSSAIGYGLGICVSDINLDGYPDVYVGNDFHENDYLYINQRNGTFKEELTERVMHTSQFSMGVDVADINNDAFPEIISVDMLPSDPYILRRSLGEDEYNTFYEKIRFGYHYQYTRNVLQLNRRNGLFSDIGLYAGVAATDWSWAPLWMDFDNDGLKDLFISNGIPKRLNDIDYVNYVSNDEMQTRINANTVSEKEMSVIDNFPQIKLPNKFFLNKGAAKFEECTVADDISSFSNGAVYADLDNDGDLDVVVNNIDDPALVYENTTNSGSNNYLKLQLTGPAQNKRAIGARAVVFTKTGIRTYEKYAVKGFQSSMEVPLLIGMNNTNADSILLIWPDNTYQRIEWSAGTTNMLIAHSETLPSFDYNLLTQYKSHTTRSFTDVTVSSNLLFRHEENRFNEFDREPLIPKMISREGPAVAVDDIDHDGLEDIFFGSSKGGKSTLFLQQKNGTFKISEQQALAHDSTYEDVDACWTDVNND